MEKKYLNTEKQEETMHYLGEGPANRYGYMSVEEACQMTIDEVKEIYRENGNL